MDERYYSVYVCDECYAEKCNFESAMLIVAGVFDKYFNDPTISVKIVRTYFEDISTEGKDEENTN